ncbi:MAG: exonuclease SbcCD subunit D [Actinomycetota bacterium]|nr:exonuclease SbcCD subunit D [Actinomycetota bacterium]
MRILHTSDWHLGRAFHGEGMLGHQAAYVDHLVEVIQRERVDLLLVSGDIYDRGLPPVDAVALADETFSRLAGSRARVVVTSGNHDSGRRLGFNSRLVDASGLHLRTDAAALARPVLLEDEHGPVAVYGIPFLEPDLVGRAWSLSARSHHAVLSEAMVRVQADLAGRTARSVVLAHAFVAGGQGSDSERDISVGGVSIVPTSTFDGIDYVALGHLHGRATLTESIRYSGSPLAYSFSEAGHVKGSWLVELGAGGLATAEFVEAPVPRRLARITGTLEELLTGSAYSFAEDAWVQATLTDVPRPLRPMDRLRERFPHAVALHFPPQDGPDVLPRPSVVGRTDHEVALDFVAAVRGTAATPSENQLLLDACDSCAHDPDADLVLG